MSLIYDRTDSAAPVSLSPAAIVKAVLLAAALAFALATPAALLFREWASPDFSHGILVPFVSLYFVWAGRDRLRGLPVRPDYAAGAVFMAMAAFVLVLGRAGRVQIAQEASIILVLPGLVALLLGRRYLRALAFPLAYLAFGVPLINPFLDRINWPFQIFTARFAAFFLPHLGVPVFRRMQFLDLPNISLEVAPGCSGVKFMISVFATAVPLAYLTQRGWFRKAILFVLAVIIGLFTNGLRVTLIGIWTYFKLGDTIHGPYHLLQGYFVALTGFALLFLSAMALSRVGRKDVKQEESKRMDSGGGSVTNASFITAMVLISGMGWYMHFFNPAPVPLMRPLGDLPLYAGGWSGKDIGNGESPVRAPGAHDELTRQYVDASGRKAVLYIGYFDSQMNGMGLVNDYFGDFGEGIEEAEVPDIRGSIRVNEKIMRSGAHEYLVLFWYDINGKTFTNMHDVKFETASEALLHRRTNGAVIMVISELKDRADLKAVFHGEGTLVQALSPVLKSYFSTGGSRIMAGRLDLLRRSMM